jgi:hypothetical protein
VPAEPEDHPLAGRPRETLIDRQIREAGEEGRFDKEVRELLARRDAIVARAASGAAASLLVRRQGRTQLESLVAQANAAISRVNAEAPSARQHRRPRVLADELRRYDETSGPPEGTHQP